MCFSRYYTVSNIYQSVIKIIKFKPCLSSTQLIVFLNLAISFHLEIESIFFVCYYITPRDYPLSAR